MFMASGRMIPHFPDNSDPDETPYHVDRVWYWRTGDTDSAEYGQYKTLDEALEAYEQIKANNPNEWGIIYYREKRLVQFGDGWMVGG